MAGQARRTVSIVVPAVNEAESLATLHQEIVEVAGREGWDYEVLLIDDGSSDNTWSVIRAITERDPAARGIRFRRNFGKAAALAAGFAEARGEIVFTLDADLQDDPAEMPRLLSALDEGYDLVSGWKHVRRDPGHKVLGSRLWNGAVSRLSGIALHDHNCGFKAYRREVTREIDLYGEFHRYIPMLAHARGFRITEVEVEHRPRQFGASKYGGRRILRGIIDLLTVWFLTRAGRQPAHILGGWGLVLIVVGGASALGQWAIRVFGLHEGRFGSLEGDASLFRLLTLLHAWLPPALLIALGAYLIPLGLVAQLVLAHPSGGTGQYAVAERTAPHPSGEDTDA